MTTAHRPTFYQALGGDNQGGNFLVAPTTKVSSRDLPGHTTLKHYRAQPRPMYSDEPERPDQNDRETLKSLLNQKEREHYERKEREKSVFGPLEAISQSYTQDFKQERAKHLLELPERGSNQFPEDEDDYGPAALNTDGNKSSVNKSADSDDSDEDDEAELLRELELIKRERQQEELKRSLNEEKEKMSEEHIHILQSNPLIIHKDTTLKRRWDDDVVFRNQAKNICKPRKRFINDTVRSDFHKKFLARYIQ